MADLKVLVAGSGGQLGWELQRSVPQGVSLVAPSEDNFDLTNHAEVQRVIAELRPDWVVNAAAYTAVDKAEDDEATAMAVNAAGVGRLVDYCRDRRVRLITFSTDYVFDGATSRPYVESDVPNPLNAYGRSKLQGERYALAYPGALVVRTSWVISGTHPISG